MSKPRCLDARGCDIVEGAFVCYTTNSRDSGLNFGHIHKIVEKEVTRYKWDPITHDRTSYTDLDFKIVVLGTDAHGQPRFQQEFDRELQKRVDTPIRVKSGRIDHSPHKFLVL